MQSYNFEISNSNNAQATLSLSPQNQKRVELFAINFLNDLNALSNIPPILKLKAITSLYDTNTFIELISLDDEPLKKLVREATAKLSNLSSLGLKKNETEELAFLEKTPRVEAEIQNILLQKFLKVLPNLLKGVEEDLSIHTGMMAQIKERYAQLLRAAKELEDITKSQKKTMTVQGETIEDLKKALAEQKKLALSLQEENQSLRSSPAANLKLENYNLRQELQKSHSTIDRLEKERVKRQRTEAPQVQQSAPRMAPHSAQFSNQNTFSTPEVKRDILSSPEACLAQLHKQNNDLKALLSQKSPTSEIYNTLRGFPKSVANLTTKSSIENISKLGREASRVLTKKFNPLVNEDNSALLKTLSEIRSTINDLVTLMNTPSLDPNNFQTGLKN